MGYVLKKILKVFLILILFFASLVILKLFLDPKTAEIIDSVVIYLMTAVVFSIIIYFIWLPFALVHRMNLLTYGNYTKEQVKKMSLWEIQKRGELWKMDKDTDYSQTSYDEINIIFPQKVKEKTQKIKNAISEIPGALKQMGEDYERGYSKMAGTPGKRIVCINCGDRMHKTFGMWSTSSTCRNLGKDCVPYETPKV